jgi:hypothetical protein
MRIRTLGIATFSKAVNVLSFNKMYYVEMHIYNGKSANSMQDTMKYNCILSVNKLFNLDQQAGFLATNCLHTKLHKKPYKARFIANSTSSTTSKLSILLTSCLTAIKTHVIRYCDKVYENTGKHLFWFI